MSENSSKSLRVWVLPDFGLDTLNAAKAAVAGFLRRSPGSAVDISVRTAGVVWTSLMRSLKHAGPSGDAGARPDLLEIPSHWTATLARLGLLEDLSELGETDLTVGIRMLRGHSVSEGSSAVFSLPWWMEVRVLYYRSDALRRCGVEPREQLATWDGLRDACRAIAKRRGETGLAPLANPNPRGSVSLADVAPAVWSRGGDLISKDGTKSLFHREETLNGVRDYVSLVADGAIPILGRDGVVPLGLFEGGCALEISGRRPPRGARRKYAPGAAREAVLPARRAGATAKGVGAVELPGAACRAGLVTARSLAILRSTSRAREAFELLRHLTGPAAARYADSIGAFPCVEKWSGALQENHPELASAFERAMSSARALPNTAATGSAERVFEGAADRLVREILAGTYEEESLRRELRYAQGEIDCVLAMNQGDGA